MCVVGGGEGGKVRVRVVGGQMTKGKGRDRSLSQTNVYSAGQSFSLININLRKQVIASKTTAIYLTAFQTTWTIKQPHILPLPLHTHHRNEVVM